MFNIVTGMFVMASEAVAMIVSVPAAMLSGGKYGRKRSKRHRVTFTDTGHTFTYHPVTFIRDEQPQVKPRHTGRQSKKRRATVTL